MLRFYRQFVSREFYTFEITFKESNLFIKSCKDLKNEAFEELYRLRRHIEDYILVSRDFVTSFVPVKYDDKAPIIVKNMMKFSQEVGVGPMACVAGAIAQEVGKSILKHCDECVVENGGDIFLKLNKEVQVGLFVSPKSPLNNLSIKLKHSNKPYGICASSAKIGPSLSFGSSDVSLIISNDAYFSDALATLCGNMIQNGKDLNKAVLTAKQFPKTIGCCFVCEDKMALWGDIEILGG